MTESSSLNNDRLIANILKQLIESCDFILTWNKDINSEEDYLRSSKGMETMAATCMLLEAIGEGVKKIDKLSPDFLLTHETEIPWKQIKGLRDHIAHGYFQIDATIIYEVVADEITNLKDAFNRLLMLIHPRASKI